MSTRKIVVLGTGGTIAGRSASAHDNVSYTAAQAGIAELLQGVPALQGQPLQVEQVAQIDSKDMDFDVWRALALRCTHHLEQPDVEGIVITHGTDTLEETAFFLHSVLDARKPVVLTGAMRPATAIAADGPRNLVDAFALANTPSAHGVMVVFAGRIHGAEEVAKVHPYRLDAFDSGDAGVLGHVEEGRARMVRAWPEHEIDAAMYLALLAPEQLEWPWVEIVLSHAGASEAIVKALVEQGAQGIVVAATGNGTVHHALEQGLMKAQAAGVRVVRATRCAQGRIVGSSAGALPALPLSPVKARIELMLQLMRR